MMPRPKRRGFSLLRHGHGAFWLLVVGPLVPLGSLGQLPLSPLSLAAVVG